jgi:hypothetical protein
VHPTAGQAARGAVTSARSGYEPRLRGVGRVVIVERL